MTKARKSLVVAPVRAMSENSIQIGQVLAYGGKVRSMIKKVILWSKKYGNFPDDSVETLADALVSHEHLSCEVVYEGAPKTLGR